MYKNKLRIAAVLENNLESLKGLADATRWYKRIHPETGNTLLHFTLLYKPFRPFLKQKAVFHYLLSFRDFPLSHKNNKGETALNLCLDMWDSSCDYFACELIKRNVSMDGVPLDDNESLLHYTIENRYVEVPKLLIQMGFDVNALNVQEHTPLWLCLYETDHAEITEIATSLLCHGADPTLGRWEEYNAFEYATKWKLSHLQEIFFLLMIDECTQMDVHFDIILLLAKDRSHFFSSIIEHARDIIVGSLYKYWAFECSLFSIGIDYLYILIKRCPKAIRKLLSTHPPCYPLSPRRRKKFFENLTVLLESDLRSDTIDFMGRFNDALIDNGVNSTQSESVAVEGVCFLLSYGLKLNQEHLRTFYKRYGFGELLTMSLYMEVQPYTFSVGEDAHFYLINDIGCNLQKVLEKNRERQVSGVKELLHYFSDPELRMRCRADDKSEEVARLVESQPEIPPLVELARNVFRPFFIETFQITNTTQFYALLNRLPIATEHIKIITYAKKLY